MDLILNTLGWDQLCLCVSSRLQDLGPGFGTWARPYWCRRNAAGTGAGREMAQSHLPTGQALETTCQREACSPSSHLSPWQILRLSPTFPGQMTGTHLPKWNGRWREIGALGSENSDAQDSCLFLPQHSKPLLRGPWFPLHTPGPRLTCLHAIPLCPFLSLSLLPLTLPLLLSNSWWCHTVWVLSRSPLTEKLMMNLLT